MSVAIKTVEASLFAAELLSRLRTRKDIGPARKAIGTCAIYYGTIIGQRENAMHVHSPLPTPPAIVYLRSHSVKEDR